MVFPPQARGWTLLLCHLGRGHSVSPAGAGMDPPDRPAIRGHQGFPRRRGDGPSALSLGCGWYAFPPQARGWTPDYADPKRLGDVSPAGAGMDLHASG